MIEMQHEGSRAIFSDDRKYRYMLYKAFSHPFRFQLREMMPNGKPFRPARDSVILLDITEEI